MSELFKAAVKDNKLVAENHYLLTLQPLGEVRAPEPGQFYMLSVDSSIDPLLKRPFSLHRWQDGNIQILYRVVGKATGILKGRTPGEEIEVIGPLGKGFPLEGLNNKKAILVAGGIGIAPLLSLADRRSDSGPILYYGARSKDELLCLDEFRSIGIEPVISTDDGSAGQKGLITDLLENFLTSHASRVTDHCIYACGPKPMLASLAEVADEYNIMAYMALEESMACGIGTCLGCAVKTNTGYKRVCKEGPVFSSKDIVW